MRDYINSKLTGLYLRAENFLNRLIKDEEGDTNFVAIIVIIVIIIGIAAIFQDALTTAVEDVMDKLLEFINS